MAACIVIVAGLTIWFSLPKHPGNGPSGIAKILPKPASVSDVSIALDKPAGKAEVDISYAPADELARSRYDYSSSGLVSVPVRIQVAENVRRSGSGGGGGLFPN